MKPGFAQILPGVMSILVLTMTSPSVVNAHALITSAVGDAGGRGTGLGVNPRINRATGSLADTTIFPASTNTISGCGRTSQSGTNNIPALLRSLTTSTIPLVTQGGTLSMTLHQVNADGAGPFVCFLDPTGTGDAAGFASGGRVEVVRNVPGTRGRSNAQKRDFELVVRVPAGTRCSGKAGGNGQVEGVCLVRCQSPVGFGGCVPIRQQAIAAAVPNRQTPQTPSPARGNTGTNNINNNNGGRRRRPRSARPEPFPEAEAEVEAADTFLIQILPTLDDTGVDVDEPTSTSTSTSSTVEDSHRLNPHPRLPRSASAAANAAPADSFITGPITTADGHENRDETSANPAVKAARDGRPTPRGNGTRASPELPGGSFKSWADTGLPVLRSRIARFMRPSRRV